MSLGDPTAQDTRGVTLTEIWGFLPGPSDFVWFGVTPGERPECFHTPLLAQCAVSPPPAR